MCLSEARAGRKLCLPTELTAHSTTLSQHAGFRRHNKVVFGKAPNGMGRKRNANLTPRDGQIGMMSLRLGHNSYFVCKGECLGEVLESVFFCYSLSLPRQSPTQKLLKEILRLRTIQGLRSPLARHAFFRSKIGHRERARLTRGERNSGNGTPIA